MKLPGSRREEKHRHSHGLREKFHKVVFLVGLAITLKGLKGWLRDKKRRMMH